MLKRACDIVLASTALLALSPVIAALALFVAWRIGRPLLFEQDRAGQFGRPFKMYKFRTMTNLRDEQGHLLPDSERLTPAGRLLRATSLDELPELWNVLKGEMSVVGPRPLLLRYLHRYNSHQARRHDVRPGLTGYAQIKGRNSLSWDEKLSLDVWYVDNRNFLLDLKIIALTIIKIFSRSGIDAPDGQPMPEFMGEHRSSHQDPESEK